MKIDKQFLVLTHLSQLVFLVLGWGSLMAPLILWLLKRDSIYNLDTHGKQIINFQMSLIVYAILCVPMVLLFGLGILGLLLLGVIALIFPVVNAIKASNGEQTDYPLSINFIS